MHAHILGQNVSSVSVATNSAILVRAVTALHNVDLFIGKTNGVAVFLVYYRNLLARTLFKNSRIDTEKLKGKTVVSDNKLFPQGVDFISRKKDPYFS